MDLNWIREKVLSRITIKNKLEQMIELVNATTKKVQQISSDLRPEMLDDLGLAATIDWYVQEFKERSGIQCTLNVVDLPILPQDISLVFYRILQEGLTNILRHANAGNATVGLCMESGSLCLVIEDDGVGISDEQKNSVESLGLRGIKERLKPCNGSMKINSIKPHGTRLIVKVPYEEKQ